MGRHQYHMGSPFAMMVLLLLRDLYDFYSDRHLLIYVAIKH